MRLWIRFFYRLRVGQEVHPEGWQYFSFTQNGKGNFTNALKYKLNSSLCSYLGEKLNSVFKPAATLKLAEKKWRALATWECSFCEARCRDKGWMPTTSGTSMIGSRSMKKMLKYHFERNSYKFYWLQVWLNQVQRDAEEGWEEGAVGQGVYQRILTPWFCRVITKLC